MTKAENPKDAIGSKKLPVHLWPNIATAYGSIGMAEGARKYGRNNFIAAPVRAHIYVAAAMRHLMAWMEGEEYSEVGVPHLGNALATIAIILKARQNGTLIDDREFLSDIDDGAYGREVIKLVECLRNMEASVQVDKEPRHWDRRDAVKELAKTGKAVKVQQPTYSVPLSYNGGVMYLYLPSDVVVKESSPTGVTLVYNGPAQADWATTLLDGVESSLIGMHWRFEQIMVRRAVIRENLAWQSQLVFGPMTGVGEVYVSLLDPAVDNIDHQA